jgi:ABC-type glycerol-3-phosphate transport system substrate-binding protein
MSARRAALVLLAGLALAGCGGDDNESGSRAATNARGGVESLDNVLQLRAAFEADKGKTRVLVLLSPT